MPLLSSQLWKVSKLKHKHVVIVIVSDLLFLAEVTSRANGLCQCPNLHLVSVAAIDCRTVLAKVILTHVAAEAASELRGLMVSAGLNRSEDTSNTKNDSMLGNYYCDSV